VQNKKKRQYPMTQKTNVKAAINNDKNNNELAETAEQT